MAHVRHELCIVASREVTRHRINLAIVGQECHRQSHLGASDSASWSVFRHFMIKAGVRLVCFVTSLINQPARDRLRLQQKPTRSEIIPIQ